MKIVKVIAGILGLALLCWLAVPVFGFATVLLAAWDTTIESKCTELNFAQNAKTIKVEDKHIPCPEQAGLKLVRCAYGISQKRVYYRLRGVHHEDQKRLLFCCFAIESPTMLNAATQEIDRQTKIKSIGAQDMRRITWIEYPVWWPRLGSYCHYFVGSSNHSFKTDLSNPHLIYRAYRIDDLGKLSVESLLW